MLKNFSVLFIIVLSCTLYHCQTVLLPKNGAPEFPLSDSGTKNPADFLSDTANQELPWKNGPIICEDEFSCTNQCVRTIVSYDKENNCPPSSNYSTSSIQHFTLDKNQTIYFSTGREIYQYRIGGKIKLVAGDHTRSAQEPIDGFGKYANFSQILSMSMGNDGNLYVVDFGPINSGHYPFPAPLHVRQVAPSGQVTTYISKDNLQMDYIDSLHIGKQGTIYALTGGGLYKVTPEQKQQLLLSTTCITPKIGTESNICPGHTRNIAEDSKGNLILPSNDFHRIFKYDPIKHALSVLSGNGNKGITNGSKDKTTFRAPFDVAVDSNDVVYVVTLRGYLVRAIQPNGNSSTIAGSYAKYRDGSIDKASFGETSQIETDKSGNVYVLDSGRLRLIRR